MHYVIADIEGTALDSFDTQRAAVLALVEMIDSDPGCGVDLFLLAYGDDGTPFGAAVRGDTVFSRVVRASDTATNRPSRVVFSSERVAWSVEDAQGPTPEPALA